MAVVRQWLREAMALGRHRQDDAAPPSTGGTTVELSDKQRAGVRRGVEVVERLGGVLLADAVGMGKTRMAVAMARQLIRRMRSRGGSPNPALFAVPARLRHRWQKAITDAGWHVGRHARITSHHRLSRLPWQGRPAVVVVDEAHKFRNPKAKRSRHLATLSADSPVILATATPVCTRRSDLHALLRYFLRDEAAKSMVGMGLDACFEADEAGDFDVVELLEQVVIRRVHPDFGARGRPALRFEIINYQPQADEAWLWRNLESVLQSLNFAAIEDDWPRGLLVNNLIRMWESGAEALRQSLEELIHFHRRWLEAADAGRRVERPQFKELFCGVDPGQQVFSFLYGAPEQCVPPRKRIDAVRCDLETLRGIAQRLKGAVGASSGRIEAIASMVEDDEMTTCLVFSAYRASARAVFEALKRRGSITAGLITGEEARATGIGTTTAREVLCRFAGDVGPARRTHRSIRVLVATDCLAEGVNLQRCSTLILADLPYSPVKLEQRIGRIARPGSPVERVTVYFPRPNRWTDSLGMRRKLGKRLQMAKQFGANHGLAQATGLGDTRDAGESDGDDHNREGPLAAMTAEERIWQRVCCAVEPGDGPAFARVDSKSNRRSSLWVRVRIESALRRHIWLWFPPGSDSPVVQLSKQLSGLARLADDRRPIAAWEPRGRQWEAAKRWLTQRRSMLEAARLAPALVGRRSEPVRLWRRLHNGVKDGEIDADERTLQRWRQKLLRCHSAAIRAEMNDLLEGDPKASSIRRFVSGLWAPLTSQAVDVDIDGALATGC